MILIRFKELSSDALKSRDTQLSQYLSYNLSVEIHFTLKLLSLIFAL